MDFIMRIKEFSYSIHYLMVFEGFFAFFKNDYFYYGKDDLRDFIV